MKKFFFISVSALIIISFLLNEKYQIINQKIDEQLSGEIPVDLPDNVFIPSGSNEGTEPVENKGHYELFKEMSRSEFYRSYTPPSQPQLSSKMNYEEKTSILNQYLTNNNFHFSISEKISKGYIFIKLNRPLIAGDIFLYWHDSNINGYKISGKIIKQKNLIIGSNQEFLFKLDEIWINRFFDSKSYPFDWLGTTLSKTNQIHYIGGYTTALDGNSIQEITIVGIK